MRILYGVCGDGMGHAIRSRPIIQWLAKKHQLEIIAGDKAYPYLKKYIPKTRRTVSLRLRYRNNRVADFHTVLYNLVILPAQLFFLVRWLVLILRFKPKIIISDFDHYTTWLGMLLGIPVISVSNQLILRASRVEIPAHFRTSYWKTRAVVRLIAPTAAHYLITTFFYPEKPLSNASLVAPILRPELAHIQPATKDFFLLYQTSTSNKKLLRTIKSLPYHFVIYGFDKRGVEGNCTFKKFNEHEFFHELASCKGLITNGGFTLIGEALHFGKPVLSVPIRGQFEQELNAHYVQKLAYGLHTHSFTPMIMRKFVKNLTVYRQSLIKYKKQQPVGWKEELTGALKQHAR